MVETVRLNLAKIKELREQKGYSISDISSVLKYKTPTGYWRKVR